MKQLDYRDARGRKFKSLIRDNDTDPSIGLIQAPPDLDRLDWQAVQTALHNALMDRGFLTLDDIQKRTDDFNKCVLSAVGKPLFRLYQQEYTDG